MSYGQYSNDSRGRSNPLRNTTSSARRQVFPSAEIPHKWAHATQDSARNAQGNFYFRGDTIYSYRDSWPLARIYRKRDGATLVLSNSERYSVTTARQQYAVNAAVRHMERVAVPRVQGAYHGATLTAAMHAENLEHFASTAADAMGKAKRAMTENMAGYNLRVANQAARDSARYVAFFKIKRKPLTYDQAAGDAARARAQRIENPDPASADKRERARAQRAAAKLARDAILRDVARIAAELREVHNAARRTDWRLHGAFESHGHFNRAGLTSGPVMLRVTEYADAPAAIETSQGASIPLAAAPMVWSLVERSRADGGRTFQGHIKIGDYAVNEVTADGDLRVGCHTIPHSELRSMARALGLS